MPRRSKGARLHLNQPATGPESSPIKLLGSSGTARDITPLDALNAKLQLLSNPQGLHRKKIRAGAQGTRLRENLHRRRALDFH